MAVVLYLITVKEIIYILMNSWTGLWVTNASGRLEAILCFWKNQTAITEPYVYSNTQKIKLFIKIKFITSVKTIKILINMAKSLLVTLPDGNGRSLNNLQSNS